MGEYRKLGETLARKGKISLKDLEAALNAKTDTRRRIGEVLVDMGLVSERDIAECLAEQFGFEVVDPSKITVDPEALQLLSREVAIAHRILPFRQTEDCIECVIADPLDFPTSDMVSRLAQKRTVLRLAPASALVNSIRKAYGTKPGRSSHRTHRRQEHSAPKPQKDRDAILGVLDGIASDTDEAMPAAASATSTHPGSRKERNPS